MIGFKPMTQMLCEKGYDKVLLLEVLVGVVDVFFYTKFTFFLYTLIFKLRGLMSKDIIL